MGWRDIAESEGLIKPAPAQKQKTESWREVAVNEGLLSKDQAYAAPAGAESAPAVRNAPPSMLGAMGTMLYEGALLNNSGEIEGASAVLSAGPRALLASLGLTKGETYGEIYRKARDEQDAKIAAAEAAHPVTAKAAKYVGMAVPVIAGTIASGGTATPMLTATAIGAGTGALSASGSSKANTFGEYAEDVGTGAVTGAALGPLARMGGNSISAAAAAKDTGVARYIFGQIASGLYNTGKKAVSNTASGALALAGATGADYMLGSPVGNYLRSMAGIK